MKVITAIGNPYLNEKLKEYDKCEVIGKDIQYQEGIIEVLEEQKEIDVLLLSNILPEEYRFDLLINKIKKLKENLEIIVFLENKNEDIENFLNSKNIYQVYYLNNNDFDIFIHNFCYKLENMKTDISEEINELKSLILSSNLKKDEITKKREFINTNISNNNLDYENNLKIENTNYNSFYEENNNNIIVVSGVFGIGKSTVSCLLASCIASKNKRTLLIDFDIFNSSINTMLGIKKYPKNLDKFDISKLIISINNNFNVLCGMDLMLQNLDEKEIYKIKEMLNFLKQQYDYIVIDTSSNFKYKYVKTVLSSGDKIIFLVEPNVSEIKKANNILEVFINDLEIEVDKIKIVFNKTNKYQIVESVLEEIFSNFQIIGNLKYDEKYSLFINKNINNLPDKETYEKIYERIKN